MEEELQQTPDELKELGNLSVRDLKYEEAILHYTHAIKLDPLNYTLHSNRSFAFLKVQQYYYALEDANETIQLNPSWPKGYFRKGEVEYATGHYTDACESYRKALELKPDDINLVEALNKTAKEILKERKADETVPWLGAGIGIVVGVIIVIADCLFTFKPTLKIPQLKLNLVRRRRKPTPQDIQSHKQGSGTKKGSYNKLRIFRSYKKEVEKAFGTLGIIYAIIAIRLDVLEGYCHLGCPKLKTSISLFTNCTGEQK
ncbi:hypothetical protein NQ314_008311 [Rhamnusium bicolor]|uniref:Uncharacterized protein n=1 Tax=Rhamnusium bicolor TaxID=1586634 RepID=A0AAV8YBD2_9CUCU|nr:hypothetical protein NQ314_008311 [Rhamnusium bicolor]